MPLSEHEQRLLDDIEKALYAEDPKFAATVRTVKRRRPGRRWIPVSVIGVLAGLGLVLLGLLVNPIPAVLGFVLIVASVTYAAVALRGGTSSPVDASSLTGSGATGGAGPGKRGSKAPATGIRARMEDRMRRRFEADGNNGG